MHFMLSRASGCLLRSRLLQIRTASTSTTTTSVKIVEVGPRDGLQNESTIVNTKDKIRLIRKLADAGCLAIEAASFVSPKWVPAMSDAKEVMEGLKDLHEILSCLVPNRKGLDQALLSGAQEIAIFASASETFSQRNINCR